MLSFRDVATGSDDADSLQTSLQEFQRRRQAKQQRQQRERDVAFSEEDISAFTPAQELAYSREVLHAWTRTYPKLREAVAALATATLRGRSGSDGLYDATLLSSTTSSSSLVFSVVESVKMRYPAVWVIPAGTVPTSFYVDTAMMEDSLAMSASASSTPQRHLFTSTAVFAGGVAAYAAATTTTTADNLHSSHHHHALNASSSSALTGRGGGGGATAAYKVTDYSHTRCSVRIRREPLLLTSIQSATAHAAAGAVVGGGTSRSASTTPVSLALASWTPPASVSSVSLTAPNPSHYHHQQQQKQRVLARWPQGKAASTKVSAVLRSIDIEARKREQWNEHVRKQQQQQQQQPPSQSVAPRSHHTTIHSNTLSYVDTDAVLGDEDRDGVSYAAVNVAVTRAQQGGGSRRGSLPAPTEDAWGRELYWPAYIRDTRAIFTGAACLHDNFHGLGLLQLYERFEPVLAMALASPLQLVVDVVYAIDETSEAFGLPIDPVVAADERTSHDEVQDTADGEDRPDVVSAYRNLFPQTPADTPKAVRTRDAAVAAAHEDAAPAAEKDFMPLLLPSSLPPVLSDLNYSFQPIPPTQAEGGEVVTAALRRSTLSTAPLSAYAILAGPVSQTHSMVLLRPTPEVICAARARALVDLETRWQRLRQALIDRLVAYEEEAPVPVLDDSEEEGNDCVDGATLVQLPDAESYISPFIDLNTTQDEGLPEEPSGAAELTEEEMRRQTRLPELQGRRSRRNQNDVSSELREKKTNNNNSRHTNTSVVSWVPPRSTSPQHAASSGLSRTHATKSVPTPARVPPPPALTLTSSLLSATPSRQRERSLVSTTSAEDAAGELAAAAARATATSSLTSPPSQQRLPLRRRSSSNSNDPLTREGVRVLDGDLHGNTLSNLTAQQQSNALKTSPSATQDRSHVDNKSRSTSVLDSTASSSLLRHRDDVTARTRQPRVLSDRPDDAAALRLSDPAGALTASQLSAEESRVLSAAVRAAALRQQEEEETLRRRQRPAAAPRPALPVLTVEAPSPASPETSASPSVPRKSHRLRGDEPSPSLLPSAQRPRATAMSEITNNVSAIDPSSTLGSTPPFASLSALQEHNNRSDASPFSWTASASPAPQQQQQQQPSPTTQRRDVEASPAEAITSRRKTPHPSLHASRDDDDEAAVGGMGLNDSSSLQFTPPQKQQRNCTRWTDTADAMAPLSPPPSRRREDTALAFTVAAGNAGTVGGAEEIAATSFSTPPPPAPPSHSGSPAPRDAVVRSARTRHPESTLHDAPATSRYVEMDEGTHADTRDRPGVATPSPQPEPFRRSSSARLLLTPSYKHPEKSSSNSSSVDDASSTISHDPSLQPVVASTAAPAAPLKRTVSSAASSTAGSDAPQLRSTVAFPNSKQSSKIRDRAPLAGTAAAAQSSSLPKPAGVPGTAVPSTHARNCVHGSGSDDAPAARRQSKGQGLLSLSPGDLVEPSFSPAASTRSSLSASSSSNVLFHPSLQNPAPSQHEQQQQQQQQSRLLADVPQLADPRGGHAVDKRKPDRQAAVQSPRSLAASAAAAALAAAAAAVERGKPVSIPTLAQRKQKHASTAANNVDDAESRNTDAPHSVREPTEHICRDGSLFYNRGYGVRGDDDDAVDGAAQQDSPLPRRPSLSKEVLTGSHAPPLAQPQYHQNDHHYHDYQKPPQVQQPQPLTGPEAVSQVCAETHDTDAADAPSNAVDAAVCDVAAKTFTQPAVHSPMSDDGAVFSSSVNREVELPATHAPSTDADPLPLHHIGSLDDAELVRLYELLYQRVRGKETASAKSHRPAASHANLENNERQRQPPGSRAAAAPSHRNLSPSWQPRPHSADAKQDGQQTKKKKTLLTTTEKPCDDAAQEHQRNSSPSRTHSSRRHHHHRHRHRHRSQHPPSTCDSDLDSVWSADPTVPTAVPPLRLRDIAPPAQGEHPPAATATHDENHREKCGAEALPHIAKGTDEPETALLPSTHLSISPQPSSAPRRAVVIVPTLHDAAAHPPFTSPSSPLSAPSSPSSTSPSRTRRHRHHHHTSSHRHRSSTSRSSRSPTPSQAQKTVLVRRVVRRRKSEVFVEEGGSLVYRSPVPLHGPSSRSSSRARSATKTAGNICESLSGV